MAAGLLGASLACDVVAAAESGARIVLLKGKAYRRLGQRSVLLREGDRVDAGSWIVTAQNGFLKVLLPDHSILSLGPNSEVQMGTGAKPETMSGIVNDEPPSVTLAQGRLRASVPPSKPVAGATGGSPAGTAVNKIKFVVRTRSAVMGVRGTEFQAIYHPANEITSVLTFEGSVAMAQSGRDLGGDGVVLITEGRFSSVTPELSVPSLPQKISPVQFDALRKEGGAPPRGESRVSGGGIASSAPALPPGLDPKLAANENASIDRRFAEAAEREMPRAIAAGMPPPEGISDEKTGAFAPAAGGFLDLKTGIYVAPPPGSRFDPNAGVFIPPQSYGTIDSRSGEYVPPTGFKLDPRRGFVPQSDPEAKGNHPKPMIAPMKASFRPENGKRGEGSEGDRPREEFSFFTPPLFPVDDPFCPECSGRELPLQPPPTAVTQIRFQIGVGP